MGKLRYCYIIKVREVIKKGGEVTELRCTHDPSSRDVIPTGKVKGVIHWVAAKSAESHTVRLYNHLINPDSDSPQEEEAKPEELGGEEVDEEEKMRKFLAQVNPNSIVELADAKFESGMAKAAPGDRFQFERNAISSATSTARRGSR